MLCHSIKYWWHLNDLCYQNVNSLVVNALLDNRKLCVANNATWSSYIQSVLRMIGRYDIWVVVVLRSPIHANEPSEYNGMLYRTSNRVLNNGIKVIILICMDGTSQYHHHRYLGETQYL